MLHAYEAAKLKKKTHLKMLAIHFYRHPQKKKNTKKWFIKEKIKFGFPSAMDVMSGGVI